MDERHQRRTASIAAGFREANEKYIRARDAFHGRTEHADIMCECSVTECSDMIQVRREHYDRARTDDCCFIVLPDHLMVGSETPTEQHARYWVVRRFGVGGTLAEERGRASRGSGDPHETPVRADLTIGIVEDHPAVRSALDTLLSRQPGFRVVGHAVNGREAVELAERDDCPDVLLLDLNMPEMDGYVALERLRQTCPHAKVIVHSSAGLAALEKVKAIGRYDIVIKGDIDGLLGALRKAGMARASSRP